MPKSQLFWNGTLIRLATGFCSFSAENSSHSLIIDQWRFRKSIQYLDDERLRVKDISDMLGYANASNFERAFRRWTKTTPRRFREDE